jgi:DEAD/DEAH box helicase domain-containing protein
MPQLLTREGLHFMGGIHATEHAMIGLFPLLAIADRADIGGISYTAHPQLEAPAIFLYDGIPGGAGLAERGFGDLERLLDRTRQHIADCPCDDGCPSCIQSPKCGNGNKPLDKAGSLRVLGLLRDDESPEGLWDRPVPPAGEEPAPAAAPRRRHGITRAGNLAPLADPAPAPPAELPAAGPQRVLIFDLETQRAAAEVGGWQYAHRMGLALAVVYDVNRAHYSTYFENDVDRLLLDLVMADRVVGFNIDRFDLQVLAGYTEWDLSRIRTLDMLAELHAQLGFRLSLGHLAESNLGTSKSGDGMQSLLWWKQGRIDLIEQYCRMDVQLTGQLYELGRSRRYLLYRDRQDHRLRIPVRW